MTKEPRPVHALLVVDVQSAFVSGEGAVPDAARLLEHTSDLAARARAAGAFVVHLQRRARCREADSPSRNVSRSRLGLADGLAYAEIARRLDRPTSTITREVIRNGGPTTYRADLAHRATERRAHRRRQAAPRGPEAPPQAHGRDAEAVREYEEMFTTLLMQSGLPKMMSRVLTCLYTTDASSLTASELVQRLQVSPASISKAITFLESQGLIRRERDERRRERYVVDNDVWYQRMIASARSHALKFRLSSKLMSPAKRPSGLTIQWPHRGSPASIETVPARGIRSGNPLGRL